MTRRSSQKIGSMNRITALLGLIAAAGLCLISSRLHAAGSSPQADSQSPVPALSQHAGTTLKLDVPTGPVDSGTSFQIPVTLTGGTDVFSFAILFDYDSTTVKLTSISPGNFLNSDGASAPVRYSDSPIGHVAISMAREPGSPGLNGKGTLCVLNFEAKASGTSDLKIERAFVVDSLHNMTPVHIAQPSIFVK
jgi:general secretion pathway protein D